MKQTVMVVDDAATVRTLIEMKLRSVLPGFHFRQAANGLAALEELVCDPPSVLVLDVNMPILDGTAVLMLLKHAVELTPESLLPRLEGGVRKQGAALSIAGVDPETLRVNQPFHPRRGCYEDELLDGEMARVQEELVRRYRRDLDLGPDAMSLMSIPRYILGEIVGREEIHSIPLILITTLSDQGHQDRFNKLGPPDAYLTKPFDAAHAGRVIRELTE